MFLCIERSQPKLREVHIQGGPQGAGGFGALTRRTEVGGLGALARRMGGGGGWR